MDGRWVNGSMGHRCAVDHLASSVTSRYERVNGDRGHYTWLFIGCRTELT